MEPKIHMVKAGEPLGTAQAGTVYVCCENLNDIASSIRQLVVVLDGIRTNGEVQGKLPELFSVRPVCSNCGTHLPSFDGDTEPKVVDSMGNQNTAFCPRCQCLVTAVIKENEHD